MHLARFSGTQCVLCRYIAVAHSVRGPSTHGQVLRSLKTCIVKAEQLVHISRYGDEDDLNYLYVLHPQGCGTPTCSGGRHAEGVFVVRTYLVAFAVLYLRRQEGHRHCSIEAPTNTSALLRKV